MALEERLKQRLLGGAVLVALVVIFVPMLIDEPIDSRVVSDHRMPEKPVAIEKAMPTILPPPPVENPAPSTTNRTQPAAETPVQAPPPSPPPREVGSNKVAKASPTAWVIQVASLTVEKNAEKLVSDLKKADLPATLKRVTVDGKRHYRVLVGPEVNHKIAMKMVEQIKRDFKLTPKIMRYPE